MGMKRRFRSPVLVARDLGRAAARYHDLVYILSRDKKLSAEDVAHCSAIGVDRGKWADTSNTNWNSTAIAIARNPTEKLVFVGEYGEVRTYRGGVSTNELIEPRPQLIRNAVTVDGDVIACGMLRQVFQRTGENQWRDISAARPKEGVAAGFEAIDGYSSNEMYAVGWNGEIWWRDDEDWRLCHSPTKEILTAICCAGDEHVYIAGRQGVVLCGRREKWQNIVGGSTVEDIWDLCWFSGVLYLATTSNLYVLDSNVLVSVSIPSHLGELDFYSLTTAEDVLWSVGEKSVLSFDGQTWQRYD